jgi:N-glycosylase/DNA lyase
MMEEIIRKIEELRKGEVGKLVNSRIKEFEEAGKKKEDAVFGELCFCLLTANFSAEKCITIQKEMGRGFSLLSEKELALELKKQGHRFPNVRANYIYEAQKCEKDLCKLIGTGKERREKLAHDVKGLGMKEASHFLRNIGFKDVAIIDFHILDLLKEEGLIEFDRRTQTLNKKKYLEIEEILEGIARKAGLNLAELDLYLWYIETGKVLK